MILRKFTLFWLILGFIISLSTNNFSECKKQINNANSVGITVLSSSIGKDYSVEALIKLVKKCHFKPVVIDWAWITFHWKRTNFTAVESFAKKLKKLSVPVYVMYRTRYWSSEKEWAKLPFQVDKNGKSTQATGRREVCYATPEGRMWGVSWGKKILLKCPSISNVIIYNPSMSCHCKVCKKELKKDKDHYKNALVKFFREAKTEFNKINKKAKVGIIAVAHKGVFRKIEETVDFAFPFITVLDTGDFNKQLTNFKKFQQTLKCKCSGGLAKVEWAGSVKLSTKRIVEFINKAKKHKVNYFFWTFSSIFRNKDYNIEKIISPTFSLVYA